MVGDIFKLIRTWSPRFQCYSSLESSKLYIRLRSPWNSSGYSLNLVARFMMTIFLMRDSQIGGICVWYQLPIYRYLSSLWQLQLCESIRTGWFLHHGLGSLSWYLYIHLKRILPCIILLYPRLTYLKKRIMLLSGLQHLLTSFWVLVEKYLY